MLRLHLLYFSLSRDSTEKGLALSSLKPINQIFIGTYKIPLNLPSTTSLSHSSQLCVLCKLGEGALMNADNLSSFYRVFGA